MTVIDSKTKGLKFEMQDESPRPARIKVVGVGGGGCNAVAHMMSAGLEGVDFYALNTDVQALDASPVPNKLAIGGKLTHGRGAGSSPEVGREAALEDTGRIVELLEGADLVFVTAGLGNGTGTGASPVVASLARELNALCIAIVTKPFRFEGSLRAAQAEHGLAELESVVDALIAIPNDRLLTLAAKGASMLEAFRVGHDLLRQIVQDIVEIITVPGLVNRDFADIRAAIVGQGHAAVGAGTARGENAAVEAVRLAVASPLLGERGIRGARNALLQFSGSGRLGLHEVNDACEHLRQAAGHDDVQINFGITLNEAMGDTVKVTIIATGFAAQAASEPQPAFQTSWLQPEPAAEPAPAEPVPVETAPVQPALEMEEEPIDLSDLDTPAFLRNRRRLS